MLSLQSVNPSPAGASLIERFFITTAHFPEGERLENKLLPSIMQTIVIDFESTPPQAKLPNGRHITCPGDLILGQYTKSCISILQGRMDFLGVHFYPGALFRVLGVNMSQFSNDILSLPDFIRWHRRLRDALKGIDTYAERIPIIEQFILENLMPAPPQLKAIEHAARLIRGTNGKISMNELCRTTGMSERSLQRYFKIYIGVSPKAFAQIARFNAVTKMIEDPSTPNWQHILDEAGYFDAAHFANDFKRITGKTPSAYYKGKTYYDKFFYAQ